MNDGLQDLIEPGGIIGDFGKFGGGAERRGLNLQKPRISQRYDRDSPLLVPADGKIKAAFEFLDVTRGTRTRTFGWAP